MIQKLLKQLWELLCVVCIALPFGVIGYFGAFCLNGVVSGYKLNRSLHARDETTNPNSDKTSP